MLMSFFGERENAGSSIAASLHEKAWNITDCAIKGMLLEFSCTPKPGLVDRQNSGANQDMDHVLFCLSSASLCSGFWAFSMLGLGSEDDLSLLKRLREKGIQVERKMFRTTGGVNTQKGLIFLMGLVCAASGSLAGEGLSLEPEKVAEKVASITRGICERELGSFKRGFSESSMTTGERLFRQYGMRGIRGEVEDALPSVIHQGLPELKTCLGSGMSMNDAMVNSLMAIMSVSDDTNVVARSDLKTLKDKIQPMAKEILKLGGMRTEEGRSAVQDMDRQLIESNINPGGSADLLAVTCAMFFLENLEDVQ